MTDISNLIGDKNGVAGGHTSCEPEHGEPGIYRKPPADCPKKRLTGLSGTGCSDSLPSTAESRLPSDKSGEPMHNKQGISPRPNGNHRDND